MPEILFYYKPENKQQVKKHLTLSRSISTYYRAYRQGYVGITKDFRFSLTICSSIMSFDKTGAYTKSYITFPSLKNLYYLYYIAKAYPNMQTICPALHTVCSINELIDIIKPCLISIDDIDTPRDTLKSWLDHPILDGPTRTNLESSCRVFKEWLDCKSPASHINSLDNPVLSSD